jgi:hypothetical protein
MTLRKLIWRTSPKSEDVQRLTAAYETAPLPVGRMDSDDRVTEIVAKTIVEICQTGMRDPELIAQLGITSAIDAPNEIAGPTLSGMDAFFLGLILSAIIALVGMLLFVAFAH